MSFTSKIPRNPIGCGFEVKENKKAILEILKKKSSKKEGKKDDKFESLVLNLALQKIDSDDFDYDGEAVYSTDKKRLIYCMSNETSFTVPEGVTVIGEMAFRGKKQLKNVSTKLSWSTT